VSIRGRRLFLFIGKLEAVMWDSLEEAVCGATDNS